VQFQHIVWLKTRHWHLNEDTFDVHISTDETSKISVPLEHINGDTHRCTLVIPVIHAGSPAGRLS
jgi:hypothetical protein